MENTDKNEKNFAENLAESEDVFEKGDKDKVKLVISKLDDPLKIKNIIKSFSNLEKEFFDIDEEKKIAKVELRFQKPSEIFDVNYITKKPILSDDFLDWINSAFKVLPSKYGIDLHVGFADMEGYTESELKEIFLLNMGLEYKSMLSKKRKKDAIAFSLIGVGIAMFLTMLLINNLWVGESVLKQIFSYIADIATTVTFWEAMCILVVENRENNAYLKDLASRFRSISFTKEK